MKSIRRPCLSALVLSVLLLCGAAPDPGPDAAQDRLYDADWKLVEDLIEDQRLEAAHARVGEIREAAEADGHELAWTRALVEEAVLRTALHGYETAVKDLRAAPWPDDPLWRAMLELHYARALVVYHDRYGGQIRQRERVIEDDEVDLEKWTSAQIINEAHRALGRAWSGRDEWGARSLGELSLFIEQNDYPARIRGTLRDAVAYLWVELLVNTGYWEPAESNEIHRLDAAALIRGDVDTAADPADPALHPLLRLCIVLEDLERWHDDGRRPEAAHEARLTRLEKLRQRMSAERPAITAHLADLQERFDRGYPWWSMGQWRLSDYLRGGDGPEAAIDAHAEALAGRDRHPDSLGGKRCAYVLAELEHPEYTIEAMAADAAEKRSIRISHRNLDRLYFRAWRYDLEARLRGHGDGRQLWPDHKEIRAQVTGRDPDVAWAVDLPATSDYREHATYTGLPACGKGAYVVMASTRRDFAERSNRLQAVNVIVTDLVLVTRRLAGEFEVTARSGETGRPLPDVDVSLHSRRWREIEEYDRARTGPDGRARLEPLERRYDGHVFGRRGDDIALVERVNVGHRNEPHVTTRSFIYTDRTVYRPGQMVHWKVVPYRGREARDMRTLAGARVIVSLRDANGEATAADTLRTNTFGSASGSFEIPAGRLLGNWTLRCSLRGVASIKVEEYKRPTFEASVDAPEDELRLNRPARLVARADYYFGLPVSEGEAVWRVDRTPHYPRWWWWRPRGSRQTVAEGRAELSTDGTLEITFTPEADERLADERDVSYTYDLSVDVTDGGGETRSASRGFRVGFAALSARIDATAGFLRPGRRDTFTVRRTTLDGAPRAGHGRWRLVELIQPERTPLPAEMPPNTPPRAGALVTPGDTLRARWSSGLGSEQAMAVWPDGRTVASGELAHGEDGLARLPLSDLSPGAYRLRYETEDAYGATCRARHDLIVAGARRPPLSLPLIFRAESASVAVGDTARFLVHSGLTRQRITVTVERDRERIARHDLIVGHDDAVIEIPVGDDLRGGFSLQATALRDHQWMTAVQHVGVPWDDKTLRVEFATFRDRLRPGAKESFRVTVRDALGAVDPDLATADATELVAYMYDRSLDLFATHDPPRPLSLFPRHTQLSGAGCSLRRARHVWSGGQGFGKRISIRRLRGDHLRSIDGLGIGGMGMRMRAGTLYVRGGRGGDVEIADSLIDADMMLDAGTGQRMPMAAPVVVEGEKYMVEVKNATTARRFAGDRLMDYAIDPVAEALPPVTPRTDFAETAFFRPHLLLDDDGAATIEFETPESVTDWNVWVHALTRDLRSGSAHRTAATVKDLMVRPYLPRFLREGDRAVLKVVVNNAGETDLEGRLDLEIFDPDTEEDLGPAFGLDDDATGVPFTVAPGAGADLSFPVTAPSRVGPVAVRVVARAGELSDGEQRPLPILPGRTHLVQSRFASLRDGERRTLRFADLAADDDPTRIDEQLVVTVDAQLFYGALNALPYLIDYPYACTEQLLNRFVSTGIVTSLFEGYPAVAEMARKMSDRDTELEPWDLDDPNRKLLLEETPWLKRSRGGATDDLIKVLDPEIALATRDAALRELRERQRADGGFPWMPGGPSSPWVTLYILHGFAKGLEFGADAPRDLIIRAWRYLRQQEYDRHIDELIERGCCWQTITFLNYVLSCYPDESWFGDAFTEDDRARMLAFSWEHWREHSPLLKGYLALTLARAGRQDDAERVFAVIMDSAKEDPELGVYWAPEARSWLWYNDTVETHAFALRVMVELHPDDARRHGLVQWLLLNRHLNHWKSTRATAEAVYALIHYLDAEGGLGKRETVNVEMGPVAHEFVFEPDAYTGADNRLVVPGDEIDPTAMSEVDVAKTGPGPAFVSATWHFSTERPPASASGDFFTVERAFFLRRHDGDEWTLTPLAPGDPVVVGDQVEVQLTIRAKHAAEYVHLRDPRGAGFEPVSLRSGYRWDQGLGFYEEIRDSGANFFLSRMPVGEYVLRHRLRATTAGTFKAQPATLQSMYAPEFAAYSAGGVLDVE